MHKLRSVTLLCAGICAGVLSTVGLSAYAEKQPAAPLPLTEIRQFTSAFNAIKDFYVDDVTDAKLLQSAVEGMVSGLDPHSSFLDVEGYKDMTESTQGSFGGLGLEVTKDPAGVRVISPIDDTPAARAGIRAGDIITRIDGKSVSDMSLNAAVKLMRGEPNTKIDLIVARKGANKPLAFSLTRALIKTQSVKMKKLDGNVGYIRISQFQERTAEDLSKYLASWLKTVISPVLCLTFATTRAASFRQPSASPPLSCQKALTSSPRKAAKHIPITLLRRSSPTIGQETP